MAAYDVSKDGLKGACYAGVALGVVSAGTATFFARSICDMNLVEWNVINSCLVGVLAVACTLAATVAPEAKQLSFRLLALESTWRDLVSGGLFAGAIATAQLFMPVLLVIWSAHGLLGVRYGTCMYTEPLLYGISVSVMAMEFAGVLGAFAYSAHAAGLSLAKLRALLSDAVSKGRDLALSISKRTWSAAHSVAEFTRSTAEATSEWIRCQASRLHGLKPKSLGFSAAENQPLIR